MPNTHYPQVDSARGWVINISRMVRALFFTFSYFFDFVAFLAFPNWNLHPRKIQLSKWQHRFLFLGATFLLVCCFLFDLKSGFTKRCLFPVFSTNWSKGTTNQTSGECFCFVGGVLETARTAGRNTYTPEVSCSFRWTLERIFTLNPHCTFLWIYGGTWVSKYHKGMLWSSV